MATDLTFLRASSELRRETIFAKLRRRIAFGVCGSRRSSMDSNAVRLEDDAFCELRSLKALERERRLLRTLWGVSVNRADSLMTGKVLSR